MIKTRTFEDLRGGLNKKIESNQLEPPSDNDAPLQTPQCLNVLSPDGSIVSRRGWKPWLDFGDDYRLYDVTYISDFQNPDYPDEPPGITINPPPPLSQPPEPPVINPPPETFDDNTWNEIPIPEPPTGTPPPDPDPSPDPDPLPDPEVPGGQVGDPDPPGGGSTPPPGPPPGVPTPPPPAPPPPGPGGGGGGSLICNGTALPAPTAVDPCGGAETDTSTVLTWTAVAHALAYYIEVYLDTCGGTLFFKITQPVGVFGTSLSMAGLANGQTYCWRVMAIGDGADCLNSGWSNCCCFTVTAVPSSCPPGLASTYTYTGYNAATFPKPIYSSTNSAVTTFDGGFMRIGPCVYRGTPGVTLDMGDDGNAQFIDPSYKMNHPQLILETDGLGNWFWQIKFDTYTGGPNSVLVYQKTYGSTPVGTYTLVSNTNWTGPSSLVIA